MDLLGELDQFQLVVVVAAPKEVARMGLQVREVVVGYIRNLLDH
jgi:hypothetical protein